MKDLKIFTIENEIVNQKVVFQVATESELLAQYVIKELKTQIYSNRFIQDSTYGTLLQKYAGAQSKNKLDLVANIITSLEKRIIERQASLDIPKSIKLHKINLLEFNEETSTVNIQIINQENNSIYLEV